uniref:Uncharacterized protein n=1 Tax=Anopheles christyi TaxID=43041 RepID=A0A182K376_9DIPT
MLRSASPYPAALAGGGGGARYGTDYRSSPLGYPGPHPGGYDGYDKYYGSYHHGPSSYPAGYYGNYPSSYRDYGGYTGHYYHQSQSPYARGGGPPMYGATPATAGSYLYPGRHYPGPSSNHHPFASRESYSYHAQREHHQQQQYSSFANYTHLPPYRTNGTHDHPGGKSHHQPTHQQQQQQYPTHQTFTAGSHNDRGLTGNSSVGEGPPSTTNTTTTTTTSAGHPSPSTSSLYSAPNGGYSSPSSDYTLAAATATGPPSSSYGSGESPQHPLAGAGEERDAASSRTPTATPTPSTALLSATGMYAISKLYPHAHTYSILSSSE